MADFTSALIDGGIPLVGTVKISGSRALALKLIYASILSGEECVLSNVPKAEYVLDDLEVAASLGIKTTWIGNNNLAINSAELGSFTVSGETAAKITTAPFLVPALIHKFGKAVLPKNRRGKDYAKIWQAFGMEVKEDFTNYFVESVKLQSAEVVLPYKSRVLTDMAIITALFILGESTILNPSTDVETDDLIDFCNKLGGDVRRQDDASIIIKGCGVFKGAACSLPYDREEVAFFIVATLLTNGNITILDLERARLLPFFNWLSKIGASYEFSGANMRIWHNSRSPFLSTRISVSPHPGFITDFAPFAGLFACFADAGSVITENILATNLEYIKDFNKLGAKIYTERSGESLAINIAGKSKLRSGKLTVGNLRYALVYLLYALVVEGKNQLINYNIVENGFEDITPRLKSLGASIAVDGL